MRTLFWIPLVLTVLPAAELPASQPTPAERAIARATQSDNPLDLAGAYVRRARETANTEHLVQAERALAAVVAADATSFEGGKIRVAIHLARQEYENALEIASALNKRTPDDPLVYGLMADAYLALGNYPEAEKQAQWMIDLRRANLGGMLRGAMLREVFGDLDGAMEWFTACYRLTSPSETEERAWLATQAGRMQLSAGKLDSAERLLKQADSAFPGHPLTLRYQAELLMARKKNVEALAVIRRLPAGLRRTYLEAQATGDYAAFEKEAMAASDQPANLNRELIFYYAGIGNKPEEALKLARKEAGRRQDIYTLDALAWALLKNGRPAEARQEMSKALATGTKDAELLARAALTNGQPTP